MKWIVFIIAGFGNQFGGNSQIDTVIVNTEYTALNFKKCKKYLFGYKKKMSSPPLHLWTKSDSAFIHNIDTIFFQIIKHNAIRIEGFKAPDWRATGLIKFYNKNSKLIKAERWVDLIVANHNNDYIYWSEEPTWQEKRIPGEGDSETIFIRTLKYSNKKEWQKVTSIYQYQNFEVWPLRTKYRKY